MDVMIYDPGEPGRHEKISGIAAAADIVGGTPDYVVLTDGIALMYGADACMKGAQYNRLGIKGTIVACGHTYEELRGLNDKEKAFLEACLR